MSYTEIMKFDKKGDTCSAGCVQNASRSAWIVWRLLTEKYLGHDFNVLAPLSEQQKTWALFYDDRLTANEKIVLGSTFDFVLVRKEEIGKVVEAYNEFSELNENLSLNEQAEILKVLEKDADCIAVGWHQNSISCEMWNNYNCISGTQHWFLFDKLQIVCSGCEKN